MNTKLGNNKFSLLAIAILCCELLASGCNSRKPIPPVENDSKIEAPTDKVVSPTEPDNNPPATTSQSDVPSTTVAEAAEPVEPSVPAEPAAPAEQPQTWSKQRIIATAPTGPILIDVSANIGGKSLEEASTAAMSRALAQIEKDIEKPWTWAKLLDHPLIASGWLGNLVPDGQQRNQLISMYNNDGDEEVDPEELPAFLTRGLARGAAFRFTDIGYAPGTVASRSPWGDLDTNNDSVLDESEISKVGDVAAKFDLNADRVITLAEMQTNRDMSSARSMGATSMVKIESAMAVGSDQKPEKVARSLLQQYDSFLGSLSRDQWQGWSESQWKSIDSDSDQKITEPELEQITTVAPQLDLKIQFQLDSQIPSKVSAKIGADSDLKWSSRLDTAGQATGKAGAFSVVVTDSYTSANRDVLRRQLAAALSNPQIATGIRTQLQLSANAFDILDADNDDKLSDEEFEHAWDWLTAIRGNRLLARWMIAETPWYRMADTDADNRLTEIELQKFTNSVSALDQDHDGSLSPIELPLTIRLEISRTDDRLANNFPTAPTQENVMRGWFAASDTNNDGVVSSSEFLGSAEDFLAYDADNDGFISATEGYKKLDAKVQ